MRRSYLYPSLLFIASLSLNILATPSTLFALERFVVDPVHSKVQFVVRHMMITRVPGEFQTFSGSIELDEKDLAHSRAQGTIEVKSISTNNEKRDAHLRSADFFDADRYPLIHFRTTKITPSGENRFRVLGELTIKNVTKEVELEVEYYGKIVDPMKKERIGFHAEGKINRKEFNILWDKRMDNGGLVVGDEVRIILDIEAIRE